MIDAADNYVPAGVYVKFRRQAVRVWMVTLFVVFAWVFAIMLAPIAKAEGLAGISAPLYHFFSFICHQLPSRSFYVDGEEFGVCSRCFGVYFGLLAGVAVYPLWRRIDEIEPLARFWLFLACIPMGIDWSLTFLGIWENTPLSRFVTGLILGVACSTFIVPALVEITRNISYRRQQTQDRRI